MHKTTQPQLLLLLMWTPLTFTRRVTADANLIDTADTEIERLVLSFCVSDSAASQSKRTVAVEWPQRQQQKWPIMSRFMEKYFNYIRVREKCTAQSLMDNDLITTLTRSEHKDGISDGQSLTQLFNERMVHQRSILREAER